MTVSVIIPVYNRENLLGEAVTSVLTQSLPDTADLELIVVDDGSTDGSADVADRFAESDARVRVVRLDHSGFAGAVRNRGVAEATGEVIAFLDSDDRWLPDKILRQLPFHTSGPYALTHTRERWIRNGRVVSQASQKHRRHGDIFEDALWKCTIGPSTAMIDADLIRRLGGFRTDLLVAEDYEFWLRALCHTEVGYLDVELTEKRAGPWEQLSETVGGIESFRIEALRPLVDTGFFLRYRSETSHQAARYVLARKLEVFASGARKRGRLVEADQLEQAAAMYRE